MFGFLSGVYEFATSIITTFSTSISTSNSTTTTFNTSLAINTTFATSRATTTTFNTSRSTTSALRDPVSGEHWKQPLGYGNHSQTYGFGQLTDGTLTNLYWNYSGSGSTYQVGNTSYSSYTFGSYTYYRGSFKYTGP